MYIHFLGNERNLLCPRSPHRDDYTHIITVFPTSNKISNNIYARQSFLCFLPAFARCVSSSVYNEMRQLQHVPY